MTEREEKQQNQKTQNDDLHGTTEEAESLLHITYKRLKRSPSAKIAGVLILFLIAVAIFAPVLAPRPYYEQDRTHRLAPPSSEFPLGADHLGRCILSRMIYGARISLQIGIIAVGIAMVIGMAMGLLGGYYGGKIDRVVTALLDVMLAFPGLLLAMAIVAALGPGLYQVMIAVGISSVPQFARVIRGSVMQIRDNEYVMAARGLGAVDSRIVLRHILPNVIAPLVVLATLRLATATLSAAGLSFLGLGSQPPTPDWGAMVAGGRNYLRIAWWVSTFPGLAIMALVLGFNLLGDAMRDALDPRLQD